MFLRWWLSRSRQPLKSEKAALKAAEKKVEDDFRGTTGWRLVPGGLSLNSHCSLPTKRFRVWEKDRHRSNKEVNMYDVFVCSHAECSYTDDTLFD